MSSFAPRQAGTTTTPPRSRRRCACGAAVTAAGGAVVRLAGLYLLERGAHNAYLGMETVKGRADGLINQVHYADAASAVVAALQRAQAGDTLVAADDAPLTREQICTVARLVSPFDARPMPAFEGGEAARGGAGTGKVIDCSYTREAVGWAPRYRTFADFIERLAP